MISLFYVTMFVLNAQLCSIYALILEVFGGLNLVSLSGFFLFFFAFKKSGLIFKSPVAQGCGFGLDVSVSSRLGLVSRIVNVSVSEGRRLGLGHLRLVPKTNFRPNCTGHSTQCERVLDAVSLCRSYYCSSY